MKALLPLCAMVFAEFLAMGIPLSVLPTEVNATLGFGAVVVGVIMGSQSWATLLTRHAAGTRADQRGPRETAVRGLIISSLSGALLAASTWSASASVSLGLILLGRLALGLGESLVITSALSWGVSLAGRERSGRVMAWVGMAMYGALAAGAPLGAAMASRWGFGGVAALAAVAPLFGLFGALTTTPVSPVGGARPSSFSVLGQLWLPGLGLAMSAVGFGAISAFSALAFEERGWSRPALAMSAFGVAYVAARVFFGDLPDRYGGARVAIAATALGGVGQALLVFAPTQSLGIAAAGLAGFGFSLAFPAFGVEAIRQVPPQSRGLALGAYTACFDLALGAGVPVLGFAASGGHASVTFALAAMGSAVASVIGLVLLRGARR